MKLLSDFAGAGQVSTVAALFACSSLVPSKLVENRWASVFAIWLGGSMVRSGLTKTGAFEVYLGKKLVWSSIEKGGEVPKLSDLVDAFKKVGVTIKP